MYKNTDPTATPAGEFTDGNLLLGIARTVFRALWGNMVQRELLNVLALGRQTPNPELFDQVATAVKEIAAEYGTPTGVVDGIYSDTAPAYWVACIGQIVNRADHPRLYAWALAKGYVVPEATWALAGNHTLFSSGNLTTTFRMPDLRAEYIRFADLGRGIEAGRAVGSWRDGMVGPHRHLVARNATNGEAGGGVSANNVIVFRGNDGVAGDNYDYQLRMLAAVEPDVGKTSLGTGTENRVRGVALLPIMKN